MFKTRFAEICPVGTFNDSGTCNLCPPGHYSIEEGATSCNACAVATYQDSAGQTSCYLCDEDHTTPSEGSTSADDCYVDESKNFYKKSYKIQC